MRGVDSRLPEKYETCLNGLLHLVTGHNVRVALASQGKMNPTVWKADWSEQANVSREERNSYLAP
jgi:hypothetical protein